MLDTPARPRTASRSRPIINTGHEPDAVSRSSSAQLSLARGKSKVIVVSYLSVIGTFQDSGR
jgi:hypothetical protein